MNKQNYIASISQLTHLTGLVDFYMQEAEKREKKDTSFIIADLDDTLASRDRLWKEEELLRINRGQEWNKVVINHFGINTIIERFYENQTPPKDISDLLTPDNCVILTAGVPEYQYKKREVLWLTHLPINIVESWEDKILETIRYVLFELWYIPKEIIVYEDRPHFFIEYRELIEWVLWTKLTIMKVEMNGNTDYSSIEEV